MYNFHTELIYRAVLFFVSDRICTLPDQIPAIDDSVYVKSQNKLSTSTIRKSAYSSGKETCHVDSHFYLTESQWTSKQQTK